MRLKSFLQWMMVLSLQKQVEKNVIFLMKPVKLLTVFTGKELKIIVIEENPIGKPLDGGTIISKNGGRYLVVSPKKAELNLFWEEREKAIAHTEELTGTSGWFIPSSGFLINEKLNVRNLWFESEDNNTFWTNDDYGVDMSDLIIQSINKNTSNRVRTFKFVGV
jgi:hypothetical protein